MPYFAWLSDSSTSPADRFVQDGACWKRVDDALVAADWADLTDGALANRIALDETGAAVNGRAWTATNTGGNAQNAFCGDWTLTTGTGRVGSTFEDNDGANLNWWTTRGGVACSARQRFYCFEQ